MAVVGSLIVNVLGNTAPLAASLAAARGEMAAFSGTTAASGGAAAGVLRGVGIAGGIVAAGTAILGVTALRAGTDFQSAMELIHTQAGASQAEVDRLTTSVLELAPSVGIGPEQLAAGLYHVESAGFRGAAAMDLLTIAAQGAKVGHADLEQVTNALIASVTSGVGGVTNMSQSMGVLNAIVGQGNMRMDDLAGAFTTGILSSAATFGVSLQSMGAALADLTRQGMPPEQAATRLRMTMSLLGAPTAKAAGELEKLGIGQLDLANAMRGPDGIHGALVLLQEHLEGSGLTATEQAQLISKAFGGGRSSAAIMALLGDLDKFGGIQRQVTKHTGDFGEAWAATEQLAAEKADQLGASVATITTAIGSGLVPAFTGVLDTILPVVTGMAQWAALNPGLASNILLVVGAVGALAGGFLIVGPLIGALMGPMGLVIAGVVLLAAAWMNNWGNIRGVVAGVVSWVQANLVPVFQRVQAGMATAMAWIQANVAPVFQRVMATVGQAVGWVVTNVFPAFAQAAGAIASWVQANWPMISAVAGQVFGAVGNALGVAGRIIANVVTTVWPILLRIANVLFPIIGVAATVLLHVVDGAFKLLGGVFHALGVVAHAISTAIGTTWGALTTIFNGVSAGIGAAIGVASGFIRGLLGVVATVAKAIGDFFGWITGNTAQAQAELNSLSATPTGQFVPANLGGTPRQPVTRTPAVTSPTGVRRSLPAFQHGGVIPGSGPQLIIGHGGETVVPRGAGGGQPTVVTRIIQLVVDGRVLAEAVDREMFGAASGFSSGFAANNPIIAS